MKLHRELDISQKAAWFMLHRIREAWSSVPKDDDRFAGPVEVDESYFGDKRANMSNAKRRALQEASAGRGPDGKGAVAAVKDRATLKRGHKGTFHKFSPKHLDRYVQEFAAKHNLRESGTLVQMRNTVARMVGRNLFYRDLIADNGLSSAAR